MMNTPAIGSGQLTLPPRRICRDAIAAVRGLPKPQECSSCTAVCEPDGSLRLDLNYADGECRSIRVALPEDSAPLPPLQPWHPFWTDPPGGPGGSPPIRQAPWFN